MTGEPTLTPAPRRTIRIGITGPIGCGKSTIAGWLAERGATVIDADDVARAVLEPGEPARAEVLMAFGSTVRDPAGGIDRAALARVVFNDPVELARLEAIVHPAVRSRILEAMTAADAAAVPMVVVEAVKLVAGGLAALCDEVWLVMCDPSAQSARLAARGVDVDDAKRRIAIQAAQWAEVRARATVLIDSSGSVGETEAAVVVALAKATVRHRS